jgi:hypothetical protein
MAEAFLGKGDGSGEYVWVMAEDAAGNSVVRRATLDFKVKPKMQRAGVFDIPVGDGEPDSIKADVIGYGALKSLNPKYWYRWNSPSSGRVEIKSNEINPSGNNFAAKISTSEGFGSGWLIYEYDDPEKPNSRIKDSTELLDSCGPAIDNASFNPYPEGDKSKPDTLRVKFTEPINGAQGQKIFIIFAKNDKGGSPLPVEVQSAKEITSGAWKGYYEFLYNSGSIAPNRKLAYTHVKIKYDTGITDEKGNTPLEDNRWVKIDDGTITKKPININIKKAWYFDTSDSADGFIDVIKVEFEFTGSGVDNAYGKYSSDFKKMFEKDRIKLNDDRHLTVESVDFTSDNSLEIKVSQNKGEFFVADPDHGHIYNPKTFVDDKDELSFLGSAVSINEEWEIPVPKGSVKIEDKIAPVITKASFRPMRIERAGEDIIDTLVVYFSEKINLSDIKRIKDDAFRVKSDRFSYDYNFEFDENHIDLWNNNDSAFAFYVKYESGNTLPDEGDSIRIMGGLNINVVDREGNSHGRDTNTVYAPIKVFEFKTLYNVGIYPNPYVNDPSSKNFERNNPVIKKYLGEEDASKLAVIVSPIAGGDRPTGGNQTSLSGRISVLDYLGNKIVNNEEFTGKDGILIWTWDGKNKNKRAVGAGIYHVIMVINGEKQPSYKIGIRR